MQRKGLRPLHPGQDAAHPAPANEFAIPGQSAFSKAETQGPDYRASIFPEPLTCSSLPLMFAPRISADVKAEHIWLMPDNDNGDGYEPLAIAGPSTITFVHGDHLGAPALLTDSQGAVVNRYDALPFGQRWASLAASPTTALAFPGQLIDAVDRHYNLHRDYDPTLGRYLQADPIGLEGGDNAYAYAEGNAVRWTDPSGLFVAPLIVPAAEGITALCLRFPAQCSATINAGAAMIAAACSGGDDEDQNSCQRGWDEEFNGYCVATFNGPARRRCQSRANDRLQACIREGGVWPPNGPGRWSYQDEHGFRP